MELVGNELIFNKADCIRVLDGLHLTADDFIDAAWGEIFWQGHGYELQGKEIVIEKIVFQLKGTD